MKHSQDKAAHTAQRLLNVRHVMERLGVTRATAYRVMSRLPGRVYIGVSGKRKQIRVPEAALDAFIATGGDQPEHGGEGANLFNRAARSKEGVAQLGSTNVRRTQRASHWLTKLLDHPTPKPSRRKPNKTE